MPTDRPRHDPPANDALIRQAARFRSMTADEKVRLAHGLWMETREIAAAGVRARHPDWTAEQVAVGVRELMRGPDA